MVTRHHWYLKESVGHIIHAYLEMKTLWAECVLRFLSIDQSLYNSACDTTNWRSFVTKDTTHHIARFNPERLFLLPSLKISSLEKNFNQMRRWRGKHTYIYSRLIIKFIVSNSYTQLAVAVTWPEIAALTVFTGEVYPSYYHV